MNKTDQERAICAAICRSDGIKAKEIADIGTSDAVLPACSGDMLFNVFDEYLEFLDR